MYSLLLQSPWLQSLGNAIIQSFWQALILLILYRGILLVFRNISPSGKYNLSAASILLSFVWFLITFIKNLKPGTTVFRTQPLASSSIPSADTLLSLSPQTATILSLAYLVMLAFLLVRLSVSFRKVYTWKKSGLIPSPDYWTDFTQHFTTILKIKKQVTIWISQQVNIPCTIGFLKPIILLPAVCLTQLSPTQIEAIILHELSHIRRNDYIINLLLSIVETILFFNPVVFYFMKTIRAERENCCDDLVIGHQYDPENYARALLTLSQSQPQKPAFAMAATSSSNPLLFRIKRITRGEFKTQDYFTKRVMAYSTIVVLLIVALPLIPVIKKRTHHVKKETATLQTDLFKEKEAPARNSVFYPNVSVKPSAPERNKKIKEKSRAAEESKKTSNNLSAGVQQASEGLAIPEIHLPVMVVEQNQGDLEKNKMEEFRLLAENLPREKEVKLVFEEKRNNPVIISGKGFTITLPEGSRERGFFDPAQPKNTALLNYLRYVKEKQLNNLPLSPQEPLTVAGEHNPGKEEIQRFYRNFNFTPSTIKVQGKRILRKADI